MSDPHRIRIRSRNAPARLKSGRASLAGHWWAVADWLGGRKPLDLILGAVAIIWAIAWLVRLAGRRRIPHVPLDPLIAFALMLLFWAVVIAYTLRMANIEKRRRLARRAARPRLSA
jgi:hypothetical protein